MIERKLRLSVADDVTFERWLVDQSGRTIQEFADDGGWNAIEDTGKVHPVLVTESDLVELMKKHYAAYRAHQG